MSAPLPAPEHRDGGRAFWIGTAVGWTVMAVAVLGAVADRRDTRPADLLRWVVAGALLHDLVWLPIVGLAGLGVARLLRGRTPRVVRWALASSAVLVIVAWPFVRGYGRRADNPSVLPRSYGWGLAAYLLVVWVIAAGVLLVAAARRRRGGAPPSSPSTVSP
jgi:hypothetical protein